MKVQVRLARHLLDDIRNDLGRPHAHAAERVGFVYGRTARAGANTILVLLNGYAALDDDRYLHDRNSGARIDSVAIRSAMQGVIDRQEGVFHVHMHYGHGRPWWSRMDLAELPRLIPSMQAVGPWFVHGLLLLNLDSCAAIAWLPGERSAAPSTGISVIGFPMQLLES